MQKYRLCTKNRPGLVCEFHALGEANEQKIPQGTFSMVTKVIGQKTRDTRWWSTLMMNFIHVSMYLADANRVHNITIN